MSRNQPISIQTTYTDSNGTPVEKQFRSLNQASKFFSITIQNLKDLSVGLTPKLPETVPHDLKVKKIETLSTPPEILQQKKEGIWFCEICHREIKYKSKYSHITTKSHLKKMGDTPRGTHP
jgi:hypothetical protein